MRRSVSRRNVEPAPCLVDEPTSSLSKMQQTAIFPLSFAARKPSRQPQAHSRSSSLGRKDVLLVLAKQRPLAAAVEEQVAAEDVVFCNVRGFGDDGQDAAAVFAAEQRQRVDIREVLHAVVRRTVHVDGDHLE